ncbi:MAG: ATP-dependent RecD-like DNA helicase [Alphaproteobacteria bacterium]
MISFMAYKKNYNSLLPDDFVLSEEFESIVEQLENTKDHFYITGKAGSGKSTLLAYFRSITQKNTAVLAPTGVAAIRVKGQTIHSFFGFPPKVIQTRHIKKVRQIELLQNLETLIIDEISMVRADVFDAIDYSLRVHRKKLTQSFGGVQVIVFGDLFQLPPVVNMDESSLLERIYPSGQFFFHSNIFQDAQFKTLELQSIYRQKDDHFIYLLNAVRDGSITHSQIDNLNDSLVDNFKMDEGKIILTTTNARASGINQNYLKQLSSEEFSYRAQATGQFYKELFPTDEVLKLKKGAQVIMIKNDPEKRWVNGSIGTIHDIAEKKIKVKINHKIYEVKKEKWDRIQYSYDDDQQEVLENITGSFKQYPMRLAWAITIHKSQGQTFEKVIIDMSQGSFAPGQLYVALSRCISLEGIELLRPLKKSDVIVNKQLIGFQDRLI